MRRFAVIPRRKSAVRKPIRNLKMRPQLRPHGPHREPRGGRSGGVTATCCHVDAPSRGQNAISTLVGSSAGRNPVRDCSPLSLVVVHPASLAMASDVLADSIFADDARSSPPLSSDNDEVNTSSARIYFGPLHSAEQKHARRADANQPTPVRRSIRLSTLSQPPLNDASSSTDDEDRMEQDADAVLAPVVSEQTVDGPLALEEDTPEGEPGIAPTQTYI